MNVEINKFNNLTVNLLDNINNNNNKDNINNNSNLSLSSNSFTIRKNIISNRLIQLDSKDNIIETYYENEQNYCIPNDTLINRHFCIINYCNKLSNKIKTDDINNEIYDYNIQNSNIKQFTCNNDLLVDNKTKSTHSMNKDNTSTNSYNEHTGTLNIFQTSLYLVKTIMGAGIVSIPILYKYYGILLGTLLIIVFSLLPYISSLFLLTLFKFTNKCGYSTFAKLAYGSTGSFIVKITICISATGIIAVYFRITASVINNLICLFISNSSDVYFCNNWNNWICILIVGLLLTTIVFRQKIEALKKATIVGFTTIIIFIIGFIILFIHKLINNNLAEELYLTINGKKYFSNDALTSMLYPKESFTNIISTTPLAITAFGYLYNLFPVFVGMKDKSKNNMQKSIIIATIICCLVYFIVGITGFIMYGNLLESSILNSLLEDLNNIYHDKNKSTLNMIVIIILCLSFLIISLISIPIAFMSFKIHLVESIIYLKKAYLIKHNKGEKFIRDISYYFNEEYLNENTNNSNINNNNVKNTSNKDNIDNNKSQDFNIKTSKKHISTDDFNTLDAKVTNVNLEDCNKNLNSKKSKSSLLIKKKYTKDMLLKCKDLENKFHNKYISYKEKITFYVVFYMLILIITILIKNISTIFGFIGSTTGNLISFILPNLFYFKIIKLIKLENRFKKSILASRILIIFGFLFMILCLIAKILAFFI